MVVWNIARIFVAFLVVMNHLHSEILGQLFWAGVANPGPGELQGMLAFVVTQQVIDQLKQLITQLAHLTWFLSLNWLLILGWKQKPAHPAAFKDQSWPPLV